MGNRRALGFQALQTVDLCFDDDGCSTESANRLSFAPTLTIRGNIPATPTSSGYSFPIVTLALGYSWGRSDTSVSCGDSGAVQNSTCPSGQSGDVASNTWGPYGSLAAAWMFHAGHMQPGSRAFAIGPMVRVDWFSLYGPTSSSFSTDTFGWTFTTGLAIGFDVASGSSAPEPDWPPSSAHVGEPPGPMIPPSETPPP